MKKVSKQEIKERVGEVLEMVHLGTMGGRRPKQLSGGQQQRVALARALVNRPKVLLLDEPLGALDLKLRKAMQVELKSLQEQVGITFVYVTHDQEEALTMSDRIAVMHQGKLLQVGSAKEVYEAPYTRFVSDFIGETNYLEGRLESLEDDLGNIIIDPDMHIKSPCVPGIQAGQDVSVAFRPEKVFLNTDPSPHNNALPGIICNIVYTGSHTTYHVELPNGVVVMVRQQNTEITLVPPLGVGEKVTISWPYEVSKAFTD